MDLMTDYYAYRHFADRATELWREADSFRLTRVLAERHAALFPRARRFGAGLIGLAAAPTSSRRPSSPAPRACPCS